MNLGSIQYLCADGWGGGGFIIANYNENVMSMTFINYKWSLSSYECVGYYCIIDTLSTFIGNWHVIQLFTE